jgi:hypothetical protein
MSALPKLIGATVRFMAVTLVGAVVVVFVVAGAAFLGLYAVGFLLGAFG